MSFCDKCLSADELNDAQCMYCRGISWIHVATDPRPKDHGHHSECVRCLSLELAAGRGILEYLNLVGPDGEVFGTLGSFLKTFAPWRP